LIQYQFAIDWQQRGINGRGAAAHALPVTDREMRVAHQKQLGFPARSSSSPACARRR
jgi:hypothetical protein